MTRDIHGYEGRYKVSDEGIIYSTPKDGKPPRILKQEVLKGNYRRVSLSMEGKVKRVSVHRLVLQAFTPNPENKPHVNHIDNDPSNNELSNLEWCTAKENIAHSHNQGRRNDTYKKGGIAIKAKNEKKTRAKLQGYLGDRFIDSFTKKGNVYCKFYCACGTVLERRQDNVSKTSVCTECRSRLLSNNMKGHRNSPMKKVASYTLDGVQIKTYESIAMAKKDTGACNIHSVLTGKQKHSKGLIWKYI